MTRERIKELWPVMEAFRNGAAVQYRGPSGKWIIVKEPMWFPHDTYRIKPTPTTKAEKRAGERARSTKGSIRNSTEASV